MQKDADLWFDDGNVVIVAQPHTAFRVHESVLARHSTVLKSILPSGSVCLMPPDAEAPAVVYTTPEVSPMGVDVSAGGEWMDGCRVVHVTDRAYDFKQMLHMFYDGYKQIAASWDAPVDFCILAAIIRCSHKYKMSSIADEPLRLLRSSLKGYHVKGMADSVVQRKSVSYSSVHFEPHRDAIEVFNLFRLVNDEPVLLTKALYICCQLSPQVLMKGLPRRQDPSVQETLSRSDMLLCWESQNHLISARAKSRQDLWTHAISAKKCECTQSSCTELLLAHLLNLEHIPDPRNALSELRQIRDSMLWPTTRLCSACTVKMVELSDQLRGEVVGTLEKWVTQSD